MNPKNKKKRKLNRSVAESRLRLGLYILLILVIGGLGCWISLFQHYSEPKVEKFYAFIGSMGTFAISVACMSFADLLLMPETDFRGTKALALYFLMSISGILGAVAVFVQTPIMHIIAITSVVFALLEWLLVHANDATFAPDPRADDALGGDATI
jgi:hypothetical protein